MSSLREALPSPNLSAASYTPPARAGQTIVINDLKRLGPGCHYPSMDLAASQRYCRLLAQKHYENFSVASFLVPRSIRPHFFNIYAYCRWSDDLADEIGSQPESCQLLEWWRGELQQCFAGQAKHPVFVALRNSISQFGLTQEPFDRLLDAFVQDQIQTRYATDQELLEYCQGSANPVGRMLLQLAQVHHPQAIAWSDSICTGLQLANFCQDIGRDALRNRIYLPKERWQQDSQSGHISESNILEGKSSVRLRKVLQEWVDEARRHLIEGLPLVTLTPRWLARDVQLFVRGGLTILDNIQRARFDVWSSPIEVTKKQKIALLLRALLSPRSTQVSISSRSRFDQA